MSPDPDPSDPTTTLCSSCGVSVYAQTADEPRPLHYAMLALGVIALWAVLKFGMLVALLAGCVTFALADALPRRWPLSHAGPRAHLAASIGVGLLPLAGLVAAGFGLSYLSQNAELAYAQVTRDLGAALALWRDSLPAFLTEHLPADTESVRPWVTELVQGQSARLAQLGRDGATGLLMTLVGIVLGILIANRRPEASAGPLARSLVSRAGVFQHTFTSVVFAQFWIAATNTTLTAIFFYLILPAFSTGIPYAPVLLALTFFCGLLPIVGNLLVNTTVTLVALTVSPVTAVAALIYLILVHKLEFLIVAKVVGVKTHVAAWELLLAMFVMDAIFGVPGLVAAPLCYAWFKRELRTLGWV